MGSQAVALTLVTTKMFRGLLAVALILVAIKAEDPDLSTNDNWRCGVFIPGKKFREPLAKFFVLQTLPPATCPPEGKPDTRSMRKTCGQMGQAWEGSYLQFDRLWKPFLAKVPGNKRPLDVCSVIQSELGIDDIPRENERKYKDGMQLGFYYNFCGSSKWKDTGLRTKSKVCCQNGVSRNCTELLEEKREAKTSTIESGGSPTADNESETKMFAKDKGGSESTKLEKNSTNPSSQASTNIPEEGKHSTEDLLKILEEGNLSEADVAALKSVLDGLKKKAEEVAEKIKQLEEVLSVKSTLVEAEKEVAVSMVHLAGCIKSVTITVSP